MHVIISSRPVSKLSSVPLLAGHVIRLEEADADDEETKLLRELKKEQRAREAARNKATTSRDSLDKKESETPPVDGEA